MLLRHLCKSEMSWGSGDIFPYMWLTSIAKWAHSNYI